MSDTSGPVAPSDRVGRSAPCPACIQPLQQDSSYVTCLCTRPSRRAATRGFPGFAGGRKSGLASCLPDHFRFFHGLTHENPVFFLKQRKLVGYRFARMCHRLCLNCARQGPQNWGLANMAVYQRGSVFWWKARLRFSVVAARPIMIRLSLRTAGPSQACMRSAAFDLVRNALMEQLPILRRTGKPDDLPGIFKRAFERELERILIAQIREPRRARRPSYLQRPLCPLLYAARREPEPA